MVAAPVPQPPPGKPRFVAFVYRSVSGWKAVAESPYREPVDYAVALMIQTMQFHGEAPVMELWGPDEAGQGWERLQGITAPSGAVATQESTELAQQSRRTSAQAERLRDRRYQLLASALAQTMRTGLGDADLRAMEQLAETVEEETVRRIGQWLAAAKSS